jgi:hypothetical protein
MSEREEYGELADELDGRADRLADHSESLRKEISDARDDWKRKRADANVPGATPEWDDPDEDADDEDAEDPHQDEKDD